MINTVTLNPAMDEILYIKSFEFNQMNRIQKKETCLGGKGTHLAYNLSLLGAPNATYGISFGRRGREVIDILEDCGAATRYLWYEAPETRTNYLIIDEKKNCTFLGSKGETLTADMTDKLLELMKNNVKAGDILIIAGDASNARDKEVSDKMLKLADQSGLTLYLDSSGAFLKTGIEYNPFLIKPNQQEFCELTGKEFNTAGEIAEELKGFNSVPAVMVSLGGDGWLFKYKDEILRGFPLKVDVANTAGCGDALLTGLCYGFSQGEPLLDILAYATALSASCAKMPQTIGFDPKWASEHKSKVKIEKLQF